MVSIVKKATRQTGKVLKSKTSGVLHATMVEFRRRNYEGSFRVQMATEPERPEGVPEYFPKWYLGFLIEGLLLEEHHLAEAAPTMG